MTLDQLRQLIGATQHLPANAELEFTPAALGPVAGAAGPEHEAVILTVRWIETLRNEQYAQRRTYALVGDSVTTLDSSAVKAEYVGVGGSGVSLGDNH